MNNPEYKSQLGWHAGFYFFATTVLVISFYQGWQALFTLTNIIYVIFGTWLASVVIGNFNYWLSSRAERRVNEQNKDLTLGETVFGSNRTRGIASSGRRLSYLMTAVPIGVAVACYLVFANFAFSN